MQHRFPRQLLLQLPHRLFYRLTDFLPGFLCTAQTDFDAQHISQHGFHQPPRQPADHRPPPYGKATAAVMLRS
jgi:hypothetical protein